TDTGETLKPCPPTTRLSSVPAPSAITTSTAPYPKGLMPLVMPKPGHRMRPLQKGPPQRTKTGSLLDEHHQHAAWQPHRSVRNDLAGFGVASQKARARFSLRRHHHRVV